MRRLKEEMIFQIANLVDQRQLVPLRHLLGLVGQVGHIGQVDQVDQVVQVDDNGDEDDIVVNDKNMFASTMQEWLVHNVPMEEIDFFLFPGDRSPQMNMVWIPPHGSVKYANRF